jgi:hypothetical protein
MRTGPRIFLACVLLSAALCVPAQAADTLSVFTDNQQVARGAITTLAAHAETDAAYGGGHIAFKYKPASSACAADPAADEGTDVPASAVAAGAGVTDVGGQTVQLDVGTWRICGWLVDDAAAATVASASTLVTVVPYSGSISVSVKRTGRAYQFTLSFSTSGPARLYASVQRASRSCGKAPGAGIQLLPRGGRLVGSDGGLGRAVNARELSSGRWRVCSWLQADGGGAGPATKTFAVPRVQQRAAHAAG